MKKLKTVIFAMFILTIFGSIESMTALKPKKKGKGLVAIEKLEHAYKFKGQKKKLKKKFKKETVLTYDKLPNKIKKMTHGSLNPPKFIHKKDSKLIHGILKNVRDLQNSQRTGKTLYKLMKQANTDNPFEDIVDMQHILDHPEDALKDANLAQKRMKAVFYAQKYQDRMEK